MCYLITSIPHQTHPLRHLHHCHFHYHPSGFSNSHLSPHNPFVLAYLEPVQLTLSPSRPWTPASHWKHSSALEPSSMESHLGLAQALRSSYHDQARTVPIICIGSYDVVRDLYERRGRIHGPRPRMTFLNECMFEGHFPI